MSADNTVLTEEARTRYWGKTRNLTFAILALWFIFSIVVPWMAPALNNYTFLGFPLGFYMIAQGSLIAFVLLIFFQNWRQDQIDDEFGLHEE
jgi:putative solute:sodium symporter small subunit